MNINKRVVLFSLDQPNKKFTLSSKIEVIYNVESFMHNRQIAFKKVLGSYKGIVEDSYCAIIDDDTKLDVIFSIAAKHNQESILVVDEYRKAYLHDVLTGDVKALGDFKAVDALTAKELDNWTLDGTQYYAVV